MVSDKIRKPVLYVGATLLLAGAGMLALAGGGMIMMDAPLLIIGGAMTTWAIIERRRATAS